MYEKELLTDSSYQSMTAQLVCNGQQLAAFAGETLYEQGNQRRDGGWAGMWGQTLPVRLTNALGFRLTHRLSHFFSLVCRAVCMEGQSGSG